MTTIQGDGQAIVFHRTRREAESQATRLSADVGRHFTSSEKDDLDKELESIENWNVTVPPELRSLLHDGTAFHHAGLGFRARRLVEELFLRGKVRLICATTTLAAGMDLPARTVILTSVRSPGNHRMMIPANSVHQMLGRAGRPGYRQCTVFSRNRACFYHCNKDIHTNAAWLWRGKPEICVSREQEFLI